MPVVGSGPIGSPTLDWIVPQRSDAVKKLAQTSLIKPHSGHRIFAGNFTSNSGISSARLSLRASLLLLAFGQNLCHGTPSGRAAFHCLEACAVKRQRRRNWS